MLELIVENKVAPFFRTQCSLWWNSKLGSTRCYETFISFVVVVQIVIVTMRVLFACRSHVLQKVCMYFTYKVRYTNSSTEIPEFPIAPEIALELLMAANFLDC